MTTNQKLINEINIRMRQRAETLLGLYTIIQDDLSVFPTIASSNEIINDGAIGPIDFTRQHYNDYVELLNIIVSAVSPELLQAVRRLQVRAIDVILSGMGSSGNEIETDPLVSVLKNRIRPRSRQLRALRFIASNDVRVMTNLLTGLNDTEEIEGLNITVGEIRVIIDFLSGLINPEINTEERAMAIDAACVYPLEVF